MQYIYWDFFNQKLVVIDLAAQTVTDVADVPLHAKRYTSPVLIDEGKAYLSIETANEAAVYVLDIATGTATKGAAIEGKTIKGFFKLQVVLILSDKGQLSLTALLHFGMKTSFKKKVLWLHKVLGLATGFIVFVVAVTGCCWVFKEEIESLYSSYTKVTPQNKPMVTASKARTIGLTVFPDHFVLWIIRAVLNDPSIPELVLHLLL